MAAFFPAARPPARVHAGLPPARGARCRGAHEGLSCCAAAPATGGDAAVRRQLCCNPPRETIDLTDVRLELTPEGPPDPRLARWAENVGEPVVGNFASPPEQPAAGQAPDVLVVLSWNVWIGRGRLRQVVELLRSGWLEELGAGPAAPLLLLVQEAYRADDSIPPKATAWAARRRPRDFRPVEDIVEVARDLRLNVRYVPSMRNGRHRSDRGNAVLATLPLDDLVAFELPFVIQRRVVVGATVRLSSTIAASGAKLHAYSAHLDPWGGVGRDWLGVAGRAEQARSLVETLQGRSEPSLPVVLGADLNTSRGRREGALRLLGEAGFTAGVPHREPEWGHTYHLVPRLPIDHLLFRAAAGTPARAGVRRLDEHPRDAGPYVFGSDHHPLLAVVEFARAGRRSGAEAGRRAAEPVSGRAAEAPARRLRGKVHE